MYSNDIKKTIFYTSWIKYYDFILSILRKELCKVYRLTKSVLRQNLKTVYIGLGWVLTYPCQG